MPTSDDPLKVTATSTLQRIWVMIDCVETWYKVMAELRIAHGRNWRGQPKIKRRLENSMWTAGGRWCWFEVPDLTIFSWIVIKHGVSVSTIDPAFTVNNKSCS
jgi:hypothetical protein